MAIQRGRDVGLAPLLLRERAFVGGMERYEAQNVDAINALTVLEQLRRLPWTSQPYS